MRHFLLLSGVFIVISAGCADPNKTVICNANSESSSSGPGNIDESLIDESVVYAIKVQVGSNKQVIDMVVDTGSTDFVVIDKDCSGEGCSTPMFTGSFDPAASTSAVRGSGTTSLAYGTGTGIEATPYTDDVALACGLPISGVTIQDVNTATELGHSVLGLAYPELASGENSSNTFVQQLDTATNGAGPALINLTLCGKNGNSGIMFGQGDSRVTGQTDPANMTTVSDASTARSGFYNLGNVTLKIGEDTMGSVIPASGDQNAIVDSGTTLWYMPKDSLDAIRAKLKAIDADLGAQEDFWTYDDKRTKNVSTSISADVLAKFPDITVEIDDGSGSTLTVSARPEQYFRSKGGDDRYFGLQQNSGGASNIFGLAFLESFALLIDRTQGGAGSDTMSFVSNEDACKQPVK